jgi:hypothetical protein
MSFEDLVWNFEFWSLELIWDLLFGFWDFSGIPQGQVLKYSIFNRQYSF